MTEPRPWRRALGWLAILGPFFFASYGFANWLASRRVGVGALAYPWEHAIPFVPWTIVPYWSIDLLYGLSLLICTTRRELDRHAWRLLFVQVVSIVFFIAFPLRFSFDRPTADGFYGALFTALGSFDKPFNQAPSLHIGLLVVIWARFAHHISSRGWRLALHGWMALIGISILTTYQHHFIDLPTGFAVGFVALWALPDDAKSPLSGLVLTKDSARRRLAIRYLVGACLFAAVACLGSAWLWFSWPAGALGFVALNYAFFGPHGFQKSNDGRLSFASMMLHAPYVFGAWINSRIWTRRHPHPAIVMDGVSIGRIPSGFWGSRGSRDLPPRPAAPGFGALTEPRDAALYRAGRPTPKGLFIARDDDRGRRPQFAAIIDLAAELPCSVPSEAGYHSFPVLDLTAPSSDVLRAAATAIEEARAHGPVLVCCALGYSRSASAVAAWLLMTRRAATVDEARMIVRNARPAIVLKREHSDALEVFA